MQRLCQHINSKRVWTRDSLTKPATTRNAAKFAAESMSTYMPGQRLSHQSTRRTSEVSLDDMPRRFSEPLARHASEWQGNTLQIEAGKSEVKGCSKHDLEKLKNNFKLSQAFKVAQALTVRALIIKGVSQANIAQTGLLTSVEAIKQSWDFQEEKERKGLPTTGKHFEEYHLREDLHGKDSMTTKRTTCKFQLLHATEAEAHLDDENMVLTNLNGRPIRPRRVLLPAPLTASTPIVRAQSFRWQTPEHSERIRGIPAYVGLTRSTFETRTRSEP